MHNMIWDHKAVAIYRQGQLREAAKIQRNNRLARLAKQNGSGSDHEPGNGTRRINRRNLLAARRKTQETIDVPCNSPDCLPAQGIA